MWLQYKAILRDSNFQRYKLQSFAADTNIGKRNYQICIKPNRKSTKKIWITQPVSNALDTLDAFLFWCCSEIYNERTNHAVLLLLLLSRHFNPILETRLSLYTNYIVLFQSSLSVSLVSNGNLNSISNGKPIENRFRSEIYNRHSHFVTHWFHIRY